MLWRHLRKSNNVVDKRRAAQKIGAVSAAVTALLGWFALGPSLPESVTSYLKDTSQIKSASFAPTEHYQFVQAMLGVSEDLWNKAFKESKKTWVNPKLVLFSQATKSACGNAGFDIGPFYCSGDYTIYIDLDFFALMDKQLKVKGDTAHAYIIFHEVGHHVQTLLGTLPATYAKMQRMKEKDSNALLVRLELQADCLAGVVFNQSKALLEPGDVEEFINAAARIGDDWLQSRSGRVMPDTFTHGTSEQRASWLLHGYKTGNTESCDTSKNILPLKEL